MRRTISLFAFLLVLLVGMTTATSADQYGTLTRFGVGEVVLMNYNPIQGVVTYDETAHHRFIGPANNNTFYSAATWARLGKAGIGTKSSVYEHARTFVADRITIGCLTGSVTMTRWRTTAYGTPGTFCNTYATAATLGTVTRSVDTCPAGNAEIHNSHRDLVLNFASDSTTIAFKGYISRLTARRTNPAPNTDEYVESKGCYVINWFNDQIGG